MTLLQEAEMHMGLARCMKRDAANSVSLLTVIGNRSWMLYHVRRARECVRLYRASR